MPRIIVDPEMLEYDDVLPFGKYKGKIVSEIIEQDPDYLRWVVDSSAWEFDEEVMQEL
jgi:uncharacterized protein (DUF3820 family)